MASSANGAAGPGAQRSEQACKRILAQWPEGAAAVPPAHRLTWGWRFSAPVLTLAQFSVSPLRSKPRVISDRGSKTFDRSPLSAASPIALPTDTVQAAPWHGAAATRWLAAIDTGAGPRRGPVDHPPEFQGRLHQRAVFRRWSAGAWWTGTDATNNARVISATASRAITAFLLSEKELLNNPPPVRALTRPVVQPRP